MRATTLLRTLLAVSGMIVTDVKVAHPGTLLVGVRPRWRRPRCGRCGRRAPGYDTLPEPRRWRALAFGAVEVWLSYAMRRVDCPCCGIHVEDVPWAAHDSRFTKSFEEMVAYLAQVTDKTTVTKLMGVSWRAVGNIVERVISERLDPSRLDGLRRLGIDEFSYRKRHHYITVVVDHDRGRAIWAGKGKSGAALRAFFDELGEERIAELETVTMDMSAAFKSVVEERAGHVEVVFDRFHVQRLVSDAVDKVRREQWRELQGAPEGQAIKNSRWALLMNPWNLTRRYRQKLSEVQQNNKRLYRAYLLKETLAKALDYLQPWRARRVLSEWLAWASRSRLQPFVKAARTIREHQEGILAYIRERLTNGFVEGINNRLRMIARRSFGFHSAGALISMLFLCCGGIELAPPLPGTH